jgi:hypothetical protein
MNTLFYVECRKGKKKVGKRAHHLWQRRDSAQSGQKALSLVRTVCSHTDKFFVFFFIIFDISKLTIRQLGSHIFCNLYIQF